MTVNSYLTGTVWKAGDKLGIHDCARLSSFWSGGALSGLIYHFVCD